MQLMAGVAVVDIEVAPGTPMAGFAARTSGSTGVHDPTSVRALVINGHGMVAVDVCALHEDTCRAIRERSCLSTVTVSATHTHSGPCIAHGRVGVHDPVVHDSVVSSAVTALRQAQTNSQPVSAQWIEESGSGVARNRRHPDRQIDPPIQALVLRGENSIVALLVSYPCHPVVLDGANTLISGDYVHFLRRRLEENWAAPAVFITGAAGDVNTGHSAEASYLPGLDATRTFARAAELGHRLAQTVQAGECHEIPATDVSFAAKRVDLSFSPLTVEQVERDSKLWRQQRLDAPAAQAALLDIWIDWAEHWSPESLAVRWSAQVSRLRIGDFAIVLLPGEPFLAVADQIRMHHNTPVMVLGYTDGVPGYLPLLEDYPSGGYEVVDAHRYYGMPAAFAAGSAEKLIAVARGLLES